MFEFKTVVVPTDLTEHSLHALDYGWELARFLRAELVLGMACTSAVDVPAAQEALTELASTLDPLCRRVAVGVGAPVDFLVELAAREEAPLVVVSTHGRRGAARRILGSTAEGLVARASCPVLTVKPPAHGFLEELEEQEEAEAPPTPERRLDLQKKPKSTEDLYFAEQDKKLIEAARKRAREREETRTGKQRHEMHLRRILVPTDFTDRSQQALEAAAEMARALGSKLVLLHVLEEGLRGEGRPEREAQREEVAAVLLGRLAESVSDLPNEFIVRTGPADRAIVDEAEKQEVDLIVMATRGRRAMAGITLGSTARRVVRRADCPVLTVRPPEPPLLVEIPVEEEAPLAGTSA